MKQPILFTYEQSQEDYDANGPVTHFSVLPMNSEGDQAGRWFTLPRPHDDKLMHAIEMATRDILAYWDDDAVVREYPNTGIRDIIEAAQFLREVAGLEEGRE